MRTQFITAVGLMATIASTAPWPAHANCPAPQDYIVRVEANTVLVGLYNYEARACPDPDGLLRQDTRTGEVVRLADFCTPAGGADAGATDASHVDECVAPGVYRYGFARPYGCQGCSTPFYRTATVTGDLPASCQRSAGNAPPTPVAAAPWGDALYVPCPGGLEGG